MNSLEEIFRDFEKKKSFLKANVRIKFLPGIRGEIYIRREVMFSNENLRFKKSRWVVTTAIPKALLACTYMYIIFRGFHRRRHDNGRAFQLKRCSTPLFEFILRLSWSPEKLSCRTRPNESFPSSITVALLNSILSISQPNKSLHRMLTIKSSGFIMAVWQKSSTACFAHESEREWNSYSNFPC